jgi:hypothetical protein
VDATDGTVVLNGRHSLISGVLTAVLVRLARDQTIVLFSLGPYPFRINTSSATVAPGGLSVEDIRMRSQGKLFMATALLEVGAGLSLVSFPALAIWLVLGVLEPSTEALIVGRVGGAGLLAIGVACWLARDDQGSRSQHGLLWAMLIYNVGACTVLAFAGWMSSMAGVALWPGVGLHGIMTIWCALNLPASAANTR